MLKIKRPKAEKLVKAQRVGIGLRANVTTQLNALKKIVATTWKLRNGLTRDVTSDSNALRGRRRSHSNSLI